MERMDRFAQIHALLNRGKPVPLQQLIERLEVSRATVVRDIEYMRERMGAPIVYDRAANGHRYDPDAPAFELPGLWFNASELHALLASEQLLEAIQPGLFETHIAPLRSRIHQLLERGGHKVNDAAHRIELLTSSRRRSECAQFGAVAEAVLNRRVIDIDYHSRSRDERIVRRVHPLRLIHYRDNWYLCAHCNHAGDLRSFSVDRIRHLHFITEPFQEPDPVAVARHLRASFGIFGGEARRWAVLRFTPMAAQWVSDEQWHPDQIGRWLGDHYELQVPYAEPTELIMEILRFGPEVEVLAPTELREEVVERLRRAVGRYG